MFTALAKGIMKAPRAATLMGVNFMMFGLNWTKHGEGCIWMTVTSFAVGFIHTVRVSRSESESATKMSRKN